MKLVIRTAVLTAVYTLLFCIFFIVKAFLIKELPPLLSSDISMWRMYTAFGNFFEWLPIILFSVCFVAFSWFFGLSAFKNREAFSPEQMKNYKNVLIAAAVSVVLSFVCVEILIPLTAGAKKRLETRISDYEWYMEHAQNAFESGNVYAARFFAENAFSVWQSPQAQKLKKDYELAFPEMEKKDVLSAVQQYPSDVTETDTGKPYSAFTLLKKARAAFETQNYFDAHYYAWWALKLAGTQDANSAELQHIAAESWNTIAAWSGFKTDEAALMFAKKREGYSALMEGDVLHAYYTFSDLYEANGFDPDIVRFYRLSTEALLRQYFFIDETQNLAYFESAKNIRFKLKRPQGGSYVVTIGGVTAVSGMGNFVKYLRDYSCLTYDQAGRFVASMNVPYVKLIAQPAESFGSDYAMRTGVADPKAYVPQLLLTSVDRKNKNIISSPVYFSAEGGEYEQSIVQLLPLSLRDFDSACSASFDGPEYMNLANLFRFVPLAESYGFPSRIYAYFLLQRACRPLALFALFIFLAVIAWNFRLLSSEVFRFVWIFTFPLFTLALRFCTEALGYVMNLMYYALTVFNSSISFIFSFAFLCVLIIAFSLRFLSLHEKK
jgi:hypothetical protein